LLKVTDIELPKLLIEDDGDIEIFEDGIILDNIDISDKELIENASLNIDEFSININEHLVIIDIENKKIRNKKIDTENPSLFDEKENKEMAKIINEHNIEINNPNFISKLSNSIYNIIIGEYKDIHQLLDAKQIKEFISIIIIKLEKRDDIDLHLLESKKYQLKRAILLKIKDMVLNSKKQSFKKLFDKNSFTVNSDDIFTFRSNNYIPNPDNRSKNFKKHKYENVHKFDSIEEYEVALYIDKMPNVIRWIRNIDSDPINSFCFQTATGKFYPDFIIEFDNGKTVVAEYKGKVYIFVCY